MTTNEPDKEIAQNIKKNLVLLQDLERRSALFPQTR